MTVPMLGVIEGFYGKTWSWHDRHAYAGFLAHAGYQFYIYAPKSDQCLRKSWSQRWDDDHFDRLRQLGKHYKQQGLQWGVGLSPFGIYADYNRSIRRQLQTRLEQLNELELDILCILFDDMPAGKSDMASRQAEVVADVQAWSTASRYVICPSYYSFDPLLDRIFGQRPQGYLEALGQSLAPEVGIFWTGNQVISSMIRGADMAHITSLLGRKVWLWDNYLANDGQRRSQLLHWHGFEGRDAALADFIEAHAVNPMNQPWLSRIPLLTLPRLYRADCYSSESATWQALTELCAPEVAAALTEDRADLQSVGLDNIAADAKARLIEKYRQFDDPYAAEVLAWLQGYYRFDPDCLT